MGMIKPSGIGTPHNLLSGRGSANAHPIAGVTGLQEVVDSVANQSTLITSIQEVDNVQDQLITQHSSQITVAGAMPITNLRIVTSYNYENNIDKLKQVKQLGFNTILVTKGADFTLDNARMIAFLDRLLDYGLYAIVSCDPDVLLGVSYASEQSRITALEVHPAVIGFYALDEPAYKQIPKADQELVYTRIKAVTSKNVFMADTVLTADKLANYYTENAFDVYMLGLFYTSSAMTPAQIISSIASYLLLFRTSVGVVPPKHIIPTFPLFSDGTAHESTEAEFRGHIDGWRPYYNGSYSVFAYDMAGLVSDLNRSAYLRKLATIIPGYFNAHITDSKPIFTKGIATSVGSELSGIRISKQNEFGFGIQMDGMEGNHMRVRPVTDGSPDTATLLGINAGNTAVVWQITKAGQGIFAGGLRVGGGDYIKKNLLATATIDHGTIPAKSSVDISVTKSGVLVGDNVFATPNGTIPLGTVWNAYVSASDTIKIRVSNITDSPIAFSTSWTIDLIRH